MVEISTHNGGILSICDTRKTYPFYASAILFAFYFSFSIFRPIGIKNLRGKLRVPFTTSNNQHPGMLSAVAATAQKFMLFTICALYMGIVQSKKAAKIDRTEVKCVNNWMFVVLLFYIFMTAHALATTVVLGTIRSSQKIHQVKN